jgi:adenylate kinase
MRESFSRKIPPGAPDLDKAVVSMRLIVVTGTPGVGKTRFSRLLAKKLGAVHIDLGLLATREKLTIGFDKARQTRIVDTEKMARALKEALRYSPTNVVLDGHFATDVVPSKLLDTAFVLRCHPEKLRRRLRRRKVSERKVSENVQAEILDVCLWDAVKSYGLERVCEIDVSRKKTVAAVNQALKVLGNRLRRRVGIVDWLALMERKGLLGKYFNEFSNRGAVV